MTGPKPKGHPFLGVQRIDVLIDLGLEGRSHGSAGGSSDLYFRNRPVTISSVDTVDQPGDPITE